MRLQSRSVTSILAYGKWTANPAKTVVENVDDRAPGDLMEVSTPEAGVPTYREQRTVGDGLVPSRCPGTAMSGAGDHNAPVRARGRPYELVDEFNGLRGYAP